MDMSICCGFYMCKSIENVMPPGLVPFLNLDSQASASHFDEEGDKKGISTVLKSERFWSQSFSG